MLFILILCYLAHHFHTHEISDRIKQAKGRTIIPPTFFQYMDNFLALPTNCKTFDSWLQIWTEKSQIPLRRNKSAAAEVRGKPTSAGVRALCDQPLYHVVGTESVFVIDTLKFCLKALFFFNLSIYL